MKNKNLFPNRLLFTMDSPERNKEIGKEIAALQQGESKQEDSNKNYLHKHYNDESLADLNNKKLDLERITIEQILQFAEKPENSGQILQKSREIVDSFGVSIASEVITIAAKNNPEQAIKQCRGFYDQPYAGKIVSQAAYINTLDAIRHIDEWYPEHEMPATWAESLLDDLKNIHEGAYADNIEEALEGRSSK